MTYLLLALTGIIPLMFVGSATAAIVASIRENEKHKERLRKIAVL